MNLCSKMADSLLPVPFLPVTNIEKEIQMMKKQYNNPMMDIEWMMQDDVLTTSSPAATSRLNRIVQGYGEVDRFGDL